MRELAIVSRRGLIDGECIGEGESVGAFASSHMLSLID
jgi:hypothetical protein